MVKRGMVGALFLGLATAPAAQEPVGFTRWTNPSALTIGPAGDRVALPVFEPVVGDQSVSTTERGAGDLEFDNLARLLVGPRCDIALTREFYDPRETVSYTGEIYTDTVCVVGTGRRGDLLTLRTEIAVVEISAMEARIAYTADPGGLVAAAPPNEPQPTPDSPRLSAEIEAITTRAVAMVVTSGGGAGSEIVVRGQVTGETRRLRRPGFSVLVLVDGTLIGPERLRPALMTALNERLEGLGREAGLLEPPDIDDDDQMIDAAGLLSGASGSAADPCGASDFCDASTVILDTLPLGPDVLFPPP